VCGSKGSSTTSSSFSPPADVAANYKMLASRAENVANTPFTQYGGEMVAGLTPTQQAGIENVNAASGMAQPYYQAATGYAQQAGQGWTPQTANQYMSPYISNVANETMANLNETNAQQQQQVLGSAIGRGAFGGDRAGIAQAELARQQGLATGQTMANVYQGGYGQAEQQFNADQARALAAGQTIGGFGTAAQSAALQGAQAQLGAGAQQQAVQQAQDTANQQQWQAGQAYPFETTQYLANLLLGIGGQSGGTSLTSQPGPNVGSQLLGGLMTLGSIPWPSDERLKENMKPVGKTFDGQNIYKFNYKGDGHTMLGLSAQEVEKHKPDAVHHSTDGMRMVDYERATEGAADRGHFADGGLADWMGGAVQEGLGRSHFATAGSVSDIPYTSQPSGGSGTSPLTLKGLMPLASLIAQGKLGGKTTIPEAPRPFEEGTMMDVAKQLANASKDQRYNMQNNMSRIGSFFSSPDGTVAPSSVILPSSDPTSTQTMHGWGGADFAAGGVVPDRKAFAGNNGQSGGVTPDVAPDTSDNTDQPSNWMPSKGQTAVEKMTGLNLSDNARMGMLAAGLGMLSSRSPFFGVGVGEGATAGLGTYYNAQANDRAFQKQQAELQLTEEARQNERARTALDASKTPAEIAELNARALSSQASLYEMKPVPGVGMVRVNKLTGQVDTNGSPLKLPGVDGSTAVPSVPAVSPDVTGQPAPAVKATEPKTAADTIPWSPVLSAPKGYLPPNQMNMYDPAIAKTAQEVAEPLLKQYQTDSDAADQQIYRLAEMKNQAENFKPTGFLAQGAYAEQRLQIAQNANAFVTALGGKPIFDPNNLAAGEEISKDSFRLGTELARTLGREPGFIVQQSVQANPGVNNTKMGWERITTGLEQAARYKQDKNTFLNDYYSRFGNLNGAEETFRKFNPPEKYAERAILSTVPAPLVSDLKKYGPDQMRSKIDSVFGQGVTDLLMRQ